VDILSLPGAAQLPTTELAAIERHVAELENQSPIEALANMISGQNASAFEPACTWLNEAHNIDARLSSRYVKAGSLGHVSQPSRTVPAGEAGHGGPGVAFICRDAHAGVHALDTHYFDAELNGGVASNIKGATKGVVWVPCLRELAKAHTVVVTLSPIDALSVMVLQRPGLHAMAALNTEYMEQFPVQLLRGKHVVLALGNDPVNAAGHRPATEAAWTLHERCLMADIAAMMLDVSEWQHNEWACINDILRGGGEQDLRIFLGKLSTAAIPGLEGGDDTQPEGARKRLVLPTHDWTVYWNFKAQPDFTHVIENRDVRRADGSIDSQPTTKDLCAFRIAGVSRIEVASPRSCMTGEIDSEPSDQFAISVQVADSRRLIRKVVARDALFNLDQWKKLGGVFNPQKFTRLLAIWQRATHIGQRRAVNFVGLCWRDGQLVVSEGPDCYFTEPENQCLYHNLVFPNGPRADAATVINAYRRTMTNGAALQLLVWTLCSHLKAFIGYWPHMTQQAEKGSGKSVLNTELAKTTKIELVGPQAIGSAFRILIITSYSSLPVAVDEFSTNKQPIRLEVIKAAQGSYQHEISVRGRSGTVIRYNQCSPILFIGEEVSVDSLISKTVRTRLSNKYHGSMLSDELPVFPLRAWLDYLATQDKGEIKSRVARAKEFLTDNMTAGTNDATANRMVENYAAVLAGWKLLAEWAGVDLQGDDFASKLLLEMNAHIDESNSSRLPWVWIVEKIFSEISAGRFNFPHRFEQELDDEGNEFDVWFIRPGHIMDHIFSSVHLRDFAASLPISSPKVLSMQLKSAGVVLSDRNSRTLPRPHAVGMQRVDHLYKLDTRKLDAYGLSAPITVYNDQPAQPSQGELA
jgi:hypothetical protein